MIQFSRFLNKLVIITAMAALFISCKISGIDGNGNVTTENRNVTGDFTSIEASNGLEVVIEQSETKSITVEADENLQQHIITKIENDVLIIESKKQAAGTKKLKSKGI